MEDKDKKNRNVFEMLGANMRVIRKRAGLRQSDVAQHLAMSRTNYINIEQGVQGMSVPALIKFCQLLSCTPNDLLQIEQVPELPPAWEEQIAHLPVDKRRVAKAMINRALTLGAPQSDDLDD